MSLSAILESPPSHLLHPAFDVQGDLLSYGFRTAGGTVHILSDGGKIVGSSDQSPQLADRTMQYEQRKWPLARLDDQWERDDVRQFLASPIALSGRDLYDKLQAVWHKHVELDHPGKYVILVCWGLMTYVYLTFSSLPFLHLLGPKGTGKSQSLDLLEALSRDGYKSRATAAVVGDLIESRRVTLLFDQANSMSPGHVDLFADSYRAGARRTIVDMDKRGEPQEFETFGPKAFAGIQALDPDLADRTILITTTPAARTPEPVVLHDPTLADLRAQSYRWALVNYWKLVPVVEMLGSNSRLVASMYPELHGHRGRQRDLWLPIEVLMEMLEVPEKDRQAAREYYGRSQAATKAELREDHLELLEVLNDLVRDEATLEITSTKLLEQLGDEEDENGRAVWTPLKVGLALKWLNVIKNKERTSSRNERRYVIDGDAVRSIAEGYGLSLIRGDAT
jgi:hypothetical protein